MCDAKSFQFARHLHVRREAFQLARHPHVRYFAKEHMDKVIVREVDLGHLNTLNDQLDSPLQPASAKWPFEQPGRILSWMYRPPVRLS